MSQSASKQKHSTDHDGEPGCQTLDELNQMFRHFWDPTKYWTCEAQGMPARLRCCGQSQLYSDKERKCVPYAEWQWTDPSEPPSRPPGKS